MSDKPMNKADAKYIMDKFQSDIAPHMEPYNPNDPTLPKLLEALGWQGGTVAQALEEVRRLRERDRIVEAVTPRPTSFTFQVEAIDGIPEAIIDREKLTAIGRVIPILPVVWHESKAEHSGIKYTQYTGRLFVMPEIKPMGQGVAVLLPEHEEEYDPEDQWGTGGRGVSG